MRARHVLDAHCCRLRAHHLCNHFIQGCAAQVAMSVPCQCGVQRWGVMFQRWGVLQAREGLQKGHGHCRQGKLFQQGSRSWSLLAWSSHSGQPARPVPVLPEKWCGPMRCRRIACMVGNGMVGNSGGGHGQ